MNKETLTVETDEYGTITYRNADDERHNPHGPAVVGLDGDKWYCINDQLHNTDGPAITRANGSKEYFINDQRHNPNGPAIVRANGHKEHWLNGKRHNPNGPAVVYADGYKAHYINGKKLTESDFKTWQAQKTAPLHNKTATIDGIEYTLISK